MNLLFVTWDGPQTSYLEGLFLPIFAGLAAHGHRFHVLQFTWGRDAGTRPSEACAAVGIPYRAQKIWRRPGGAGPFGSALWGAAAVRRAVRDWSIDAVMPRSLMPALAVLTARLSVPVVFDADGLMADERVDFGGLSSSSLTYRLLRDVEAQMTRRAAVTLVRTSRAADVIRHRAGPGVAMPHVVSNGRDPLAFSPGAHADRASARQRFGIPADAPLLVYCGSLGPQYCLPEMLRFYDVVRGRRADAHLLILTGEPTSAETALRAPGSPQRQVTVARLPPNEVPAMLAASDLGLAFRRTAFSTEAVAPIKVAEYLLSGLAVAGSVAGDIAPIYAGQGGGNVGAMTDGELQQVAAWFTGSVLADREGVRRSAREAGLARFTLERTIAGYARAIDALQGGAR